MPVRRRTANGCARRWTTSACAIPRTCAPPTWRAPLPRRRATFLRGHIAEWEAEREQWEQELRRIDARDNPMLVRRLAVTPRAEHERTVAYKRFAYEGLVERANVEIAWAQRGLELVDRLDG